MPGGRLLHLASHRRANMNQRLSSIENTETSQMNGHSELEAEMSTANIGLYSFLANSNL